MTDARAQTANRVGVLALVVLLIQAGVLLGLIAPVTEGFLPQMQIGPYTSGDFFTFVVNLDARPDRFDLYEPLLQWVDPIFVLLFSLWLFFAMRPRVLALIVIVVYAGLEITENALLFAYLDQLRSAIQVAEPAVIESGMADPKVLTVISTVTPIKLGLAVLAAVYTPARMFLSRKDAV
ncbi:hypothetical protein [Pacificoceanicola onchidii]|uniref:hypothetical protein n=1 Tax=Pacificoceanicola onchidii TaxID=2562685 RepID=UPI0010A4D384|nr:hypothetical protein [Pacificoceanicola onchidii]